MASSSSDKKVQFSNLPDQLKWSKKQRNQRVTRRTPATPPQSKQPLPVPQLDGVRSAEVNQEKKSGKTSKPTKAEEPTPSKKKEAIPARKTKSKESSSSKVDEDKPHSMPKISLTLTREEIEEDFFAMTGKRLPRNIKKRDKNLQKDIDTLVPGLSLEGQSAETLRKSY